MGTRWIVTREQFEINDDETDEILRADIRQARVHRGRDGGIGEKEGGPNVQRARKYLFVLPDYKGELAESGYFVQKMRTTRATMPDELNVRAGHRVAGNVRRGLRYRHLQSSDRLSDRRLGGGYALRQTEYRAGRGQIIALEFRSGAKRSRRPNGDH